MYVRDFNSIQLNFQFNFICIARISHQVASKGFTENNAANIEVHELLPPVVLLEIRGTTNKPAF